MNIAQFNYLEAFIWLVCCLSLLGTALIKGRREIYFKVRLVAGCTFLVFAGSDVIEAHTGAWWRPLGLFALPGLSP